MLNNSKYSTLTAILDNVAKDISTNNFEKLIKTGFTKLDEAYYGIAPTEFWVVGGYTSTGKSFFLLQLFLNMIRQKKKCLFFSLEMSNKALAARLWGNFSNLSSSQIEWGNLTLDQHTKKTEGLELLKVISDFGYFSDQSYTIKEIEKIIEEVKPDVVFVDYLQNLISNGDEYSKLTTASAQLQLIAKKNNCAVIAASQVSNEEAKTGADSKIIGFKGSGAIAAACDFAIWLESEPDYENEASKTIWLYVRKSRRGPIRKMKFSLLFPSGQYVEAQ